MKVLIYSEYSSDLWGSSNGGSGTRSGTVYMETKKNLGADSIEVTVVTHTTERMEEESRLPFRLERAPGLAKLIRLIWKADVLHLAGPALLPLALGLVLGKPLVVEHHGFQVACPNGLLFYEPTQSPCPGHFMARRYEKCVECNRGQMGALKSLYWTLLTHARRWLAARASLHIMPTNWLGSVLKLKRMRTVYHGISGTASGPTALTSVAKFAYQRSPGDVEEDSHSAQGR